jgi:hypothetical protein
LDGLNGNFICNVLVELFVFNYGCWSMSFQSYAYAQASQKQQHIRTRLR